MGPNSRVEASYPISFRGKDAKQLGEHLRARHNVELVGIKRVGISNFLRFFLYNKDVVSCYINHGEKHIFVPVDLNDLIEREIFPFWILTFKRLVDACDSSKLPLKTRQKVSSLFLSGIQSQDHFLTIEYLKQALREIINEEFLPTLFLLRFDRLETSATPEFFNNLQGLIDATGQKMCFVFTSFRPLDTLNPKVFNRSAMTTFSHVEYLKPAYVRDITVIYETLSKQYSLAFPKNVKDLVLRLAGGHVQYLHLSLIILKDKKTNDMTDEQIYEVIISDERIKLQYEEIWESLNDEEKEVLFKTLSGKKLTEKDKNFGRYLLSSGIINEKGEIFSPLFLHHFKNSTNDTESVELTKKENMLFKLLSDNLNEVCERDKIIHFVWPESEEVGVSDWTIDRLVARLRNKLSKGKKEYSIVTVKTRGYKLVKT